MKIPPPDIISRVRRGELDFERLVECVATAEGGTGAYAYALFNAASWSGDEMRRMLADQNRRNG